MDPPWLCQMTLYERWTNPDFAKWSCAKGGPILTLLMTLYKRWTHPDFANDHLRKVKPPWFCQWPSCTKGGPTLTLQMTLYERWTYPYFVNDLVKKVDQPFWLWRTDYATLTLPITFDNRWCHYQWPKMTGDATLTLEVTLDERWCLSDFVSYLEW